MKTTAGVAIVYLLLLLAPSSEAAVRKKKLDSIEDLRRVDFGGSVPKSTLVLLHWFANKGVNIDDYGELQLTFDPNGDDFGSHHYGNFEGLLNQLHGYRYKYYTIGNMNREGGRELPSHIVYPQPQYAGGGNRARIIVRVQEQNLGWQTSWVVDEIYITQHHQHPGTEYDPQHTHQVTTNLLRQIREFPMRGNYNSLTALRNRYTPNVDNYQLREIQQEWSNLACLGLLVFIVVQSPMLVNPYRKVPAKQPGRPPSATRNDRYPHPKVPARQPSRPPSEIIIDMPPTVPYSQRNEKRCSCKCICLSVFVSLIILTIIIVTLVFTLLH